MKNHPYVLGWFYFSEAMKSSKQINFQFVIRFVLILSLIIIYIFQWGTMIFTPSLRTGTDFMAFFAAGKVTQSHGFSNIYNIDLQQTVQESIVGFPLADGQVLLYNHVPYLVPILSALVSEDYIGSFARWAVLLLIIHVVATIFIIRNTENAQESVLIFGAILFFPFFQSLLLGQDTSFLFLGIALWSIGLIKKRDWLAAIGLALTSVRPHLCIVMAAPLLFRNHRILWRFLIVISILILTSLLLIEKNGTFEFIAVLQISAEGTWYGMHEADMINLIGMAARTLPFLDADIIRMAGWIGYLIGIMLTVLLWQRDQRLTTKIGGTLILALFFAPHLHYHDLTVLLIPFLLLNIKDSRFSDQPLVISLFMLILKPLYYVIPYLLYGSLMWALFNGIERSEKHNL